MVWLTNDPAFGVDPRSVALTGLRYTDPAAVKAKMQTVGDVRPSILLVSTRSMEAAIKSLPTVASARVRATLPDQLAVTVTERQPILTWRVGDEAWLVDVDGSAFAPASEATADELGDGATGSALPAVDDLRAGASMSLMSHLDPIDLEAVRSLGNVTPGLVNSTMPALFLSLDDKDGWVLTAPGHWRAVFGHYTQTLASPTRIPLQVQCLKSLLRERESTVDEVTLAVSADRCGSFRAGTPEPRPRATRTPRPGATRRPNRAPRP